VRFTIRRIVPGHDDPANLIELCVPDSPVHQEVEDLVNLERVHVQIPEHGLRSISSQILRV
jgi:hypothetical protein